MSLNSRASSGRLRPAGNLFLQANPAFFRLDFWLGLLFCLALGLALVFLAEAGRAHAASATLKKNLEQEKKKADRRKSSLERLTKEERKANADLAAAEARILKLEQNIADQQKRLLELAKSDDAASLQYKALVAQRQETEAHQAEVLRLLWDVNCRRESVGGREMADWAAIDRTYAWSRDLYLALEKYHLELAEQEADMAKVIGRRNELASQIQASLDRVNEEKERVLQSRVQYSQRLADLRKQKRDAESELVAILKLVEDLNFKVEAETREERAARERDARAEAERQKKGTGKKPDGKGSKPAQKSVGSLAGLKGKLPYPVSGRLKVRYSPKSSPPVRGVGFSTERSASVTAVAPGKVVHNDLLRGFGWVVIVMHGSDYFSLYAFLENSNLKIGQTVAANQKVGQAGFYPALNGPGMYFELRHHHDAINPEGWFGL